MSAATVVGRTLLAAVFLRGAVGQLQRPQPLADLVERATSRYGLDWLPVPGRQLVLANGAVMLTAGSGLALGVAPRACALALTAALVPTTAVGHAFWEVDDPARRSAKLNSFLANVAIIGGLTLVAADERRRR